MRKITITFELDDSPWVDDEGDVYIHDVPTEALDIVIGAIEGGTIGFNRFVEARLDGELLVDGGGHASDAAKGSIRYGEFVRRMDDLHDDRPLIDREKGSAYDLVAFLVDDPRVEEPIRDSEGVMLWVDDGPDNGGSIYDSLATR